MARFNLSTWALEHASFVLFLMILLGAAGIYAYLHLGRMEDPSFTVKSMVVKAEWPGASADQVALQLTDRIEKKLQEIADVDYLSSFAKPGVTQITVTLRDNVPASRVPAVWYQVRKKIGDIQHTLPQGARGPYFNDEFGDTFGNVYAFTRDGFDYADLRRYVDQARDELLRVPDVGKVQYLGVQDEKLFVETSSARLSSLGIDPQLIENTLRATNGIEPAGVVETSTGRIALRVSGAFDSVEAIAALGIQANGRAFRLGDIARVRRGYVDPPTSKMHFDGREAIGLAIAMRDGGNVLALGRALEAAQARIRAALPVGIEMHVVSDQPRVVKSAVAEFTHSLAEAIVIVLGVSFLSLGLRAGLVVALSIPLVLAMTFLAMYACGIELHRISLGALIIALGLLVDDAIIAIEMMALKLEEGVDRARAAAHAYATTAWPMLTGTLITVAGFMPVGLARSGAGEYTASIFSVVGLALMLSWLVAVLFTPYLGYRLLPTHGGPRRGTAAQVSRGTALFTRLLRGCLVYRRTVLGATFALFVAALALFRVVPQEFFPASSRPELMVDLWLPQAASFAATEKAVSALEASLASDADVLDVTSYLGVGSPRFYLPLDVQLPNLNFAQIMVMTRDEHARERVMSHLEGLFARDFPELRARVARLENGPPVGYPVQFRISGPDAERLAPVVRQVEGILRADPAIRSVNTDAGERLWSVRVALDQDKVRALGISSQEIAHAMQAALSGQALAEYREGDQTIDVVARLELDERSTLDTLNDTKIHLRDGRFVPLSQLASLRLEAESSLVRRRNRMANVNVRADVGDDRAPDVTARLWPAITRIAAGLPLGYRIEIGGSAEQAARSQTSIVAVVPLMIAVVLVLLMAQLQSMRRCLLVVLTAPLGLIGVSGVLAVSQVPFGFVAMLGTVALGGMVIRNSVILIDQIEQDRRAGMVPWEAVMGATVRRLRPIVLTALAAVLAMIPLTRSTFWGPMAWAIMGGLSAATLLTLFVLPTMYATLFRVRQPESMDQATQGAARTKLMDEAWRTAS